MCCSLTPWALSQRATWKSRAAWIQQARSSTSIARSLLTASARLQNSAQNLRCEIIVAVRKPAALNTGRAMRTDQASSQHMHPRPMTKARTGPQARPMAPPVGTPAALPAGRPRVTAHLQAHRALRLQAPRASLPVTAPRAPRAPRATVLQNRATRRRPRPPQNQATRRRPRLPQNQATRRRRRPFPRQTRATHHRRRRRASAHHRRIATRHRRRRASSRRRRITRRLSTLRASPNKETPV